MLRQASPRGKPLLDRSGTRTYGSIASSLDDDEAAAVHSPKRFMMLALFFSACFAQGIVWTPLSALPASARAWFPALTSADIYWSLNVATITYIPFSLLSPWLLMQKRGMQRSVRVGIFFSMLSAAIRVPVAYASYEFRASPWCNVLLQLAGACCGAAGPFTQGSPSRFSAIWFPPGERTRATAVGFLGTYLGTASSYLVAPALVQDPSDFPLLAWVEALVVGVPFVLIMLHFPDAPDGGGDGGDDCASADRTSDAEYSEDEPPESFSSGMRQLSSNCPFLLLMVAAGLLHGVYATWGASLALLLQPEGFSAASADSFSFSSTVLYVIGSYVIGEISDRYFRQRTKALICVLLALSIGTFAWFSLSVPSSLFPEPPLPALYEYQLSAISLHGLLLGCTAPPFFELAAELTHPVPEGTSANLIGLVINGAHVLSLVYFPYVSPLVVNPSVFVVYLVCLGCVLCCRESYGKTAAQSLLDHDSLSLNSQE